jgi:nicotinate-nucleotide pyrophosphorylase
MDKILGLLDTLESLILDSLKIPMTGKTLINESEVLAVIDKIRLVMQGDPGIMMRSPQEKQESQANKIRMIQPQDGEGISGADAQAKAMEIIQQAYQVASEIKAGANKYADDVLSNLEANANRIIRTIKNGRQRLNKTFGSDIKTESSSDSEGAPLEI